MLLVILVIYSAWISPFELAFLSNEQDALFIIDNIVNGFFAVDIVLTFFVAYLDSQSYLLVDEPKKIAVRWKTNHFHRTFQFEPIRAVLLTWYWYWSVFRYISTWFIFDVCSTAPFQSISLLFTNHNSGIGFKVLNMLRLWRLRRVSSLVVHWTSRTRVFVSFSFASQNACTIYGALEGKNQSSIRVRSTESVASTCARSNVVTHLS